MFRIALPGFLIVMLAAWSAAAQPYRDDGLLGGPPPSAYTRSRADIDLRPDPRADLRAGGRGGRGGVVIDRAPLPLDPYPLPANSAPGDCVERGSQGWTSCVDARRYDDYGRPQDQAGIYDPFLSRGDRYGGHVLSDTTTESRNSSYFDSGYRPSPGYGPGFGYGYGYSSDYPSGVGYAYGYPDGGFVAGYHNPYGYGAPRGYRLAGKDSKGYLVWPGKVSRR